MVLPVAPAASAAPCLADEAGLAEAMARVAEGAPPVTDLRDGALYGCHLACDALPERLTLTDAEARRLKVHVRLQAG
jgi:hypothetical protein